jgi:malic enzyme
MGTCFSSRKVDRTTIAPSARYRRTVPVEIINQPGMLGRVASGIGAAGGDLNNVRCFPGFFRGLLDARARAVNADKIAAARALAAGVSPSEFGPEYSIPSVFNKAVVPAVAGAVAGAAHRTDAARRRRPVVRPAG